MDLRDQYGITQIVISNEQLKEQMANLCTECVISVEGNVVERSNKNTKIATGEISYVIFLRDPLTAQPHEPDVTALIRLCDVHHVPIATNLGTAEVLIKGIKEL